MKAVKPWENVVQEEIAMPSHDAKEVVHWHITRNQ